MSSWFAAIQIDNKAKLRNAYKYCLNNNHRPRHILKPKNIFKSKCELKKKLKKYKLRKDGVEDQDIIDVSHTLLSVLKIKSPNTKDLPINSVNNIELRPKNYLFNMAKRKHMFMSQESKTITVKTEAILTPPSLIQNKRATDAFKLMMDSRSKSIGGNSPGKEKSSDTAEKQETLENKEIKVKRNLVLQKLAESKGSLKKKEIEEYEEQYIKIKMEKRAERLKNMIKKNAKHRKLKEETSKCKNEDAKQAKAHKHKVQLIDLFHDDSLVCDKSDDDCILSKVKLNQKSKDDEEFLKKLSPSIRKKENMLCYFKKNDKNQSANNDDSNENCSENVTKVTIGHKKEKKLRKKLSLNTQSDDILKDHDENKSVIKYTEICNEVMVMPTKNSERRKRKRKENSEDVFVESTETNGLQHNISSVELNVDKERRSQRNITKPVKYIDDIELSSSNDELHIFTPKIRKSLEGKNKRPSKIKNEVHALDENEKSTVQGKEEKKVYKKPAKLAPIFNTKPQLTPKEIEAKQKFLYSGVPEQLKKLISLHSKNIPDFVNSHPVVVHIQQKEESIMSSLPFCDWHVEDNSDEDETLCENISYKKLLTLSENKTDIHNIFTATEDAETVLQFLKNSYPKFPVYRTYSLLKGKCKGDFKDTSCPDLKNSTEAIKGLSDIVNENPDNLTWTDKYKILSTNQLIGNFEAVKDLKKWLISWTENELKPRKSTMNDSDSSDFCYDSDIDSRDGMKTTNNLLVISGPVGCGKSSTVYSVAAELAFKVIEVNASSKRTGKMMLQDLQEATQSHKVNRGTGSAENSQKSQEVKPFKSRGRPKKVYENRSQVAIAIKKQVADSSGVISQENARTSMSLILIDDADIVFDQDDGFSSAVAQLVYGSKRPVILITTSLSCLHLQRFIQCGRVLNMNALLPKMLGTWVDLLCLAERSICWPGLGAKFLDHFKGDIRKTINSLQFCLTSDTKLQTKQDSIPSQNTYINIEDECSSLSWAENEAVDERIIKRTNNEFQLKPWKYFMGEQMNSLENYHSFELFSVWWSIPSLLNPIYRYDDDKKLKEEHKTEVKRLETVTRVLETLSVADYIGQISSDRKENICSQPWCEFESDSVSELEDLNNYSTSYNTNKEIVKNWVTSSVLLAQMILQTETKTDIDPPGMMIQRQRNRKISRHQNLSSFLNPSSILDRKALALDYWSTCRSICRIEKIKADVVSKRHNRFCHYLKSLNAECKMDSLDKLCYSLRSTKNME